MNGLTCGGALTGCTLDPYFELVVPNCADAVPSTARITRSPSKNARNLLSSEMSYRIPTSFETFWQYVGIASPTETADQSTRRRADTMPAFRARFRPVKQTAICESVFLLSAGRSFSCGNSGWFLRHAWHLARWGQRLGSARRNRRRDWPARAAGCSGLGQAGSQYRR